MKKLGFGLGYRPKHFKRILSAPVRAEWFEALTENYFGIEGVGAGEPLRKLLRIRERFPVCLHGVSLSIASSDELSLSYIKKLKDLKQRIEPSWISDHLCWTSIDGQNLHDLLPIPYTNELLEHVVPRVQRTQEYLGEYLVLENVSSYLAYAKTDYSEAEFLAELTRRTGCKLLLDVNNIYVSAVNHGLSAEDFLQALPRGSVQQIHLAGHTVKEGYLIDTHNAPVSDPVWRLYRSAIRRFGSVSTMVEWDANIPDYEVLEAELDKARAIERSCHELERAAATL